jgi:CBS domain containing-hemolysin-like protein
MESNITLIVYFASLVLLTVYSGAFTALEVLSIARQERTDSEAEPSGFTDRLLDDPLHYGIAFGLARSVAVALTAWSSVRLVVAGYFAGPAAVAAFAGVFAAASLLVPVFVGKAVAVRGGETFLVSTRLILAPTAALLRPVGALVESRMRKWWPGMLNMLAFQVIPLKDKIDTFGSGNGGTVDEEQRIMSSIKDFGETRVREVMVPRIDIVAVSTAADKEEAVNTIIEAGHSRIPLYEDSVDRVVGTIYTKDLLRRMVQGEEFSLREIAREAFFVPESKMIDDLLTEFKLRKQHLAIVVDEYGGTAGIVTLEDVLEELVGDIQDEFDFEEELVKRVDDDTVECNAKVRVDELNEAIGLELAEDVADSLGGLLFHEIGHVPEVGATKQIGGLTFEVLSVERQRIDRVLISGLSSVSYEDRAG